jgi:hypothetical protein
MAVARSVLRLIAGAVLVIVTIVIVIGTVATPAAATTPIRPRSACQPSIAYRRHSSGTPLRT